MRSVNLSGADRSVVRIPFSFDRYSVTATLSSSDTVPTRPRQGREAASRFLELNPRVHLEVRCPTEHALRTLCFDDGRYQGYRVDRSPIRPEDCPERSRFLSACRDRLRASPSETESAVPLSGPARAILSELIEHSRS